METWQQIEATISFTKLSLTTKTTDRTLNIIFLQYLDIDVASN